MFHFYPHNIRKLNMAVVSMLSQHVPNDSMCLEHLQSRKCSRPDTVSTMCRFYKFLLLTSVRRCAMLDAVVSTVHSARPALCNQDGAAQLKQNTKPSGQNQSDLPSRGTPPSEPRKQTMSRKAIGARQCDFRNALNSQ